MDAISELREAVGYDPESEQPVDVLIDYKDSLEERCTVDAGALDRINVMLSDPSWGVGMLEDICAIVRATGRVKVPGAHWDRH